MSLINIEKYESVSDISMHQAHMHEHYEIQFLVRGDRMFFIGDTSYRLCNCSIAVVPPDTKHLTGGGPFLRYNLNVFPAALSPYHQKILDEFLPHHVREISDANMSLAIPILEELLSIDDSTPYKDERLQSVFGYIIFKIEEFLKDPGTRETSRKPVPITVYRIIEYINQHLAEPLSLEKIAKHFNFSVPYVRKQFQSYYKYSLGNYILLARIEEVKKLLVSTDLSVTEIAKRCGFSSSNYLCLMFKKKENISPLTYRKLKLT